MKVVVDHFYIVHWHVKGFSSKSIALKVDVI